MKEFGTMPDGCCVYRIAIIALGTTILSGCEAIVFGSLYTSAATVNAIERHTLPILEAIDFVEIQKDPMSPKADLMASNLGNPQDIADLVKIVNSNRSSWKNAPLRVAPPVILRQPESSQEVLVSIIFWKKDRIGLKVNVNKRILTTQMGSETIYREISETDAGAIARMIETSKYATLNRPVYRYRLRTKE